MDSSIGDELPDEKRKSTAQILHQEINNERRWRLSYLKDQFESLELHQLFKRYIQRISHGYFSQFLTLQIILITSHFVTLLALVSDEEKINILPDLIIYGLISILSVFLLIVTDLYVKEHPKLLKFFAGTAFVVTFFMNAFIPFYNRIEKRLRPAYTPYLIISNYIFLNIHNDMIAFVVGLFISIFHIVTLILVTYEDIKTEELYPRIGSDAIFLFAINCLGMYFRYMNEIVIRRSFLDRRSCVESTHELKFEEEQENLLMSSIIPQHFIAKVRKSLTEYAKDFPGSDLMPKAKPFKEMYVEEHPNVTILFADIVNYTAMTTQLNVIDLLDILNEMFGRFDDASEKLKVLRIKFLGDCYYCVAGLPPDPAPNHAEACVDLGLKMISIIADIRQRKNLDINMRIGIHSGSISSGIIGSIKWQYDIWSKDVDTANKMETEGMAGMVHITQATKSLLRKWYKTTAAKKVNDEDTFLIEPPPKSESPRKDEHDHNNNENQRRPTIYIKRTSNTNDFRASVSHGPSTRSFSLISSYQNQQSDISEENEDKKDFGAGKRHTFPNSNERRASGNTGLGVLHRRLSGNVRVSTDRRLTANDKKRRTAFMNNNIKRYKERLEETNKELEVTIENMLLSKFEQWFKASDMFRILLVFKDGKGEMNFIKNPDPLFKYYLLSEVLILLLVYVLENLTLSKWDYPEWPFYVTVGLIIFVGLPLTWTHYIWTKYIATHENDHPTSRIISVLYETSKFVTNNYMIRFLIYTIVYVLLCLCVLYEWLDCYEVEMSENKIVNYSKIAKRNFLTMWNSNRVNSTSREHCIVPWHMTETFALAIMMSFLFLRMYMWLKLLYASIIAAIYSFCILNFSVAFYGDSQTFNYALTPEASHVMGIIFLTIILHLVDRQTEYMNRIDHLWYKKLVEKEEQATNIHFVNTVLLKNILPTHVAELYLNVNRQSSDEMYHETYPDVSVMFASITNFSVDEIGPGFLKIMSDLISEFDMVLLEEAFKGRIEKIKIAKWTYMAACGLVPGLGDAENIRRDPTDHVVILLLKFATRLLKTMQEKNAEMQQEMKLRIGISHGFVAAGVVGSRKPLYDVWGDPVNMASRMDTLGQADRIQVLEPTAEIIQSYGYKCIYRGEIKVKGREREVPTYFVALDDNFELIKKDSSGQNDDSA